MIAHGWIVNVIQLCIRVWLLLLLVGAFQCSWLKRNHFPSLLLDDAFFSSCFSSCNKNLESINNCVMSVPMLAVFFRHLFIVFFLLASVSKGNFTDGKTFSAKTSSEKRPSHWDWAVDRTMEEVKPGRLHVHVLMRKLIYAPSDKSQATEITYSCDKKKQTPAHCFFTCTPLSSSFFFLNRSSSGSGKSHFSLSRRQS